ncbi:hypothetical protein H5A40_03255 [Pectobacterium brasiliense]|uniref:hypothetical protein n=1 Tax=Pectobacterium brasiliense TaxID=180957 RepID=UPI001968DC21|nr:hypothetical protein [Pectobacterium brasiliense]MBN3161962.1 hypothetical protein [Pectobacterium brasiliense]QSD36187.1 hypothetical protein H5A40_03255 [Pectobacterium brasiliense]
MKIHIIGGPGSGKTVLARNIASRLNCGILHLDDVAYCNGNYDMPTMRKHRLAEVSRFTKYKAWVIEGVYFSWAGSGFKHCDKIFYLSVDKNIRKENILKKLEERFYLSVDDFEKQKARLLKANAEYDKLFDERISGFLKRFEDKVVVLNEIDLDVRELLAGTNGVSA